MIGTNKYKRPAVLIFIFDKVERQIHIDIAIMTINFINNI